MACCTTTGPCAIGVTWDGTPKGDWVDNFAGTGLAAYVAKPASAATGTPVLQLSDIFGAKLKNAQLYADELAAAINAPVVLPDFFYVEGAGAWPPGSLDPSKFGAWLAKYPRDQVMADADKIIAGMKKEFNATSVKAIGFCWGGLFAALLAGPKPAVSAAVLLHPSLLTQADVDGITAPVLFLTNGEDQQVSDEFRAAIIETLKSKPSSSLHHYPDARHGHTLRADPTADSADAFKRTVAWLKEH
jgi:dienelactone hydrolase